MRLSKLSLVGFVATTQWVFLFSLFGIVLQPDIVLLFHGLSNSLFVPFFALANLIFLGSLFLFSRVKFINGTDKIVLLLFLLQIVLILKNFGFSGVTRNSWIAYSLVFYFFGRLAQHTEIFSLNHFLRGLFISAFLHVVVSVSLRVGFILNVPELVIAGSNIVGFQWKGVFLNRATGLFSSPLTLSGFLLLNLCVLTYFVVERRRLTWLFALVLFGFLLTVSRGSFLAFAVFALILISSKPQILKNKVVLFSLAIMSVLTLVMLQLGVLNFDRLFSSASLEVSTSGRTENHSTHLVDWTDSTLSIFFGDSSNQLGIDSDVLNYVFNFGIFVLVGYFALFYSLLRSPVGKVGIYFSAGLIAKLVDGLLSGSSLGPPTIFAIFYLIGIWVGYQRVGSNRATW